MSTVSQGFAATPASDEEPVYIRADRAWEAEDSRVLTLEGSFHMRTSKWEVFADRAEVHGDLADPDLILATGAPARIRVFDTGEGGDGEGRSARITYRYQQEILELSGDAELLLEKLTIRSNAITYDVANDRLKSSSDEGVQLILQP